MTRLSRAATAVRPRTRHPRICAERAAGEALTAASSIVREAGSEPGSRLEGGFGRDLLVLTVLAIRDAVEGLSLARLEVSGVALDIA